jgi:hypothetical protein
MADLNYKDWGRIYAYMWLQDYVGNPRYKNLFDTDPVQAITEIIQALNKEYPNPDLKIEYTPNVDTIWDIGMPPGANEATLKEYRDGTKPITLRMTFAC